LLRSRELEMKARLVGPVGVGAVPYVTPEDIEAVVSMWTGIPVEHMLQDERDRLQRLPQALKVVSDDWGVEALTLRDWGGPLGRGTT
jgi:ATP-dependent Clp protease ATP-binding subunit ClpA